MADETKKPVVNAEGDDTAKAEDDATKHAPDDATGSSTDTGSEEQGNDEANDGKHASDDATAWKSLARKWETRSKSNLEELEKVKAQAEKLQNELEALKADTERAEELSKIAEETGVPQEILEGYADIDTAKDAASKIKAWAGHKKYPSDQGGAPQGEAASTVTKASIESLTSPIARVKARAAHADLYRKQ